MNSIFITGTSTVGKTYLSKKLSAALGIPRVSTDFMRIEMLKDPLLEPWVNMSPKTDEEEYFRTTTCDDQWQRKVNKSEAFWPTIKKHIETALQTKTATIFEGVNLLPHLMDQLDIRGVVLFSTSEEEIFERLKLNPRWGTTEALMRKEAHAYFTCEGRRFVEEAEQFDIPTYSDMTVAEQELRRLILLQVQYLS